MARCDQCEVISINGLPCHETGCLNAWRDPVTGTPYLIDCFDCGGGFRPDGRHQTVCLGCQEDTHHGDDMINPAGGDDNYD